jgi:hypothetical protein
VDSIRKLKNIADGFNRRILTTKTKDYGISREKPRIDNITMEQV